MRLAQCGHLGDHRSLLDCPGSVEFAHAEAAVVDLAVVVCDPVPSRALALAPVLRALDDAGPPYLMLVNKLDAPDAGVRDTVAALQAYSRRPLVLRQVAPGPRP